LSTIVFIRGNSVGGKTSTVNVEVEVVEEEVGDGTDGVTSIPIVDMVNRVAEVECVPKSVLLHLRHVRKERRDVDMMEIVANSASTEDVAT